MLSIIRKLLNLRHILVLKLSPPYNKLYFFVNSINYGKDIHISGNLYINNQGAISIGDRFNMVSGNGINPISSNLKGYIYTEPGAEIKIGDRVGMASTRMWIANKLTIGNCVSIGANVLIIDTDCHQIDYRVRHGLCKYEESPAPEEHKKIQTAPIVIEDNVWIGAHSIILKGVTIGARSIIGAGSVVTNDIPADCIAVGNPCKVIRYI